MSERKRPGRPPTVAWTPEMRALLARLSPGRTAPETCDAFEEATGMRLTPVQVRKARGRFGIEGSGRRGRCSRRPEGPPDPLDVSPAAYAGLYRRAVHSDAQKATAAWRRRLRALEAAGIGPGDVAASSGIPEEAVRAIAGGETVAAKAGDLAMLDHAAGHIAWMLGARARGEAKTDSEGGKMTEIRQYERGDAPEVRVGWMRGVILQDGSFNFNGRTVWIVDEATGPDHVAVKDLFVEADKCFCVMDRECFGHSGGGERPIEGIRCESCDMAMLWDPAESLPPVCPICRSVVVPHVATDAVAAAGDGGDAR